MDKRLVKVTVEVPLKGKASVTAIGWSRSKDAELCALDKSQFGFFYWNVTHRATGMAVPGTDHCERRKEALEYLDELEKVKGWERVRWATDERGDEGRVTGISKRLAKDARRAIAAVSGVPA